ncbi:MAG: Ig-like domain-containing protein [Ruminococcus sp.]|nr:Ig-like domain-containing protein [Ruminococcus sp.]
MDNNTGNRPRKRVTKKMLRQRQLGALAIVAFLVLFFVVLGFKACSNGGGEKKGGKQDATTTTTTIATTTVTTTVTTTTTTNPLASLVTLSKREMFLTVGGTDVSIITGYPTGSTEANEVWKSMDESIATVDSFGHVTAVGQGETFVILSFDNNPGIEIEIKVHVASTAGGTTAPKSEIIFTEVTPSGGGNVVSSFTTTPVAAVYENRYSA